MDSKSDKNMPPKAKKVEHLMSIHGYERNDQYYWLRDDTRKNKQVLDYLEAENDYTKKQLSHTEDLQKKLFEEMTGRLEPNVESVPTFDKGYWFWDKYIEGQDYPIHVRQKGTLDADEQLLLDQNKRSEGHEYYQLAAMDISPNQKLMAISEDVISRRRYDIRIKNLQTAEFFPEVIENTSGQVVWANDNKTLFYVRKHPTTLLPNQVYRHELGTSAEKDVLVYEEQDATFYISIYKTRSEKFIVIEISSTMNSEVKFVSADTPSDEFTMFLKREKEHLFTVDHIGDQFYIQSDFEALNERLWKVAEEKIGTKEHWQEVIAHREDTLIQNFELFNDYLVLNERVKGLEKLRIRDYAGKIIADLAFDDEAYNASFGNNPDPASRIFRYAYSSMNTPSSVYDYNVDNKTSELKKQDKVIGEFHPAQYHSERIMIDARDGVKVPVSIVYRKDKFNKDSTNPLLHYGYGSYGASTDPSFSISRLSLLDRGVVFAISHIRGSNMLGRKWYEDGKKLTKMNTFTDFNDATKSLVKQGYGNPERVYAMGGSAGGLLMGAIINMEPDLYHGVIASVPFVDVITTMLDESIPLTSGDLDEWGNPKNKEYYDYMLSYSPYDQVKVQNYPHLLVTTGLHDSQVQYWEPAKWVAKLRDMKTDNNLLLLDTDMEVGHGGKSGRYKRYLDRAKEYAFLLDLAGIKE
ncbi:MAG: oligopeptidase B [Gammaproteobacteria bacterium]|nr:MAG: oligopeptidase B [Gammaproteobacteria bacterium]